MQNLLFLEQKQKLIDEECFSLNKRVASKIQLVIIHKYS